MDSAAKIINCFIAAVRDVGLNEPSRDAVRNIIGLSLREAFDRLFPDAAVHQQEQLVHRYRAHFLTLDQTRMQLFPGVIENLNKFCQDGYLLAVATGKASRGLRQALQHTNTEHLFAVTRCADEAPSKPHPQMVLDILAHTGVDPQHTVLVGDTVYDLQMARDANVGALAVSYGAHQAEQLRRHAPLACVDSFPEVYEWIYQQQTRSVEAVS